jgi:transposase
VVDQNNSIRESSSAVNVVKSIMGKWVKQLKNMHQETSNYLTPPTADRRKLKELEKTIKLIEMDKEILKKATALLMPS